jgi:hypothetical protein
MHRLIYRRTAQVVVALLLVLGSFFSTGGIAALADTNPPGQCEPKENNMEKQSSTGIWYVCKWDDVLQWFYWIPKVKQTTILSPADGPWPALYVAAELGYTGDFYADMRARTPWPPDGWETFDLANFSDGTWGILSPLDRGGSGGFASTEMGYGGDFWRILRARADRAGAWERYDIICLDSGCPIPGNFAFYSRAAGKYVSAEKNWGGDFLGQLRARADVIGPWETFWVDPPTRFSHAKTAPWLCRTPSGKKPCKRMVSFR